MLLEEEKTMDLNQAREFPEALKGADLGVPSSWSERDAAVVWHGFTQMSCFIENEPVIVDRGEGRELIDVEGRRYLDAISSLWVTTLGHAVPELDEAVKAQLGRVAHSTMLGNGNRVVVELAEALAGVVPLDDPHFLFASDGASAVEQALKIAFQYWTNLGVTGRMQYLALGDAYHGDTMGSLSLGSGGFGTDVFDPLRFPVLRTLGYSDPNWLGFALQAIEQHAPELAAVVVEPLIQGAGGMLVSKPEDLRVLGNACHDAGVLLICDEVATGFGRTGTLFASEQCGLRPDLLCLGKGITGGYLPMSVTVANRKIFDAFLGPDLSEWTFYHGHSYGGNALAAAVALRHLQLFEEWQVLSNVVERGEQLGDLLADLVGQISVRAEVRRVGLMCGIELFPQEPDQNWGRWVCASAVRRGVLLRPLGNVVVVVPPLTVTSEEIVRIVSVLRASIDEVCV